MSCAPVYRLMSVIAVFPFVFHAVSANDEKLYRAEAVTSVSGLGLNNFLTTNSAGLPQPVKRPSVTDAITERVKLCCEFKDGFRMMSNAKVSDGNQPPMTFDLYLS